MLVTWSQRITKFSVKKVARGTIIDMPWWYKTWQHSGYNYTRVKQKIPRRHIGNVMKFLEPTRKPKVIYTDTSLEFGKFCEELSWNHCTSTQIRNKMGLLKEQCAESRTGHLLYCYSPTWMKNCGLILWNATVICETFKTSLADGKTPYERRSGMPFNGPVTPFRAMVEYHPIPAKDPSRLHQFGAKVLPGIFLGYALYAGKFGKETLWSQTLKKWRRWTHLNSTLEGSMQRKC